MAETAQKIEEFPVKIEVERHTLLKSLARLQAIVERRNTISILSNVKIEAFDGNILLTTTDMDIVASESISANIEADGVITVPAQTLYDIVRKLPEGSQISLASNPATGQVKVVSGSAKFNISYLPADEFPVISDGQMDCKFSLQAGEFVALLDKARFAMSTEETRYYLNGVYLHATTNKNGAEILKVVSTDGHRLAAIETALPDGASDMPSVIIPRKTVNELVKLLAEQTDDVTISLSESKIKIQCADITILSKLVDGTFPDYNRVIPENNNLLMEIDNKLLSQAVDRVAIIATDKTKGIKFMLSKGKLALSASGQDAGSASEEVDINYDSDNIEIGFNSRYVLDITAQLEGETTQFLFSDANAPAIVSDPTDVSALYVIMPMRV